MSESVVATSPPRPADPLTNALLAALPKADMLRWKPALERVELPLGAVLHDGGAPLKHVYFPVSGIVSLLYLMSDGASAEIAVIGREGFIGMPLIMGGKTTPSQAVVQAAGEAFRVNAAVVQGEFDRGGAAMHLLLRYTQALLTQIAMTAVCNRHHSVDQQLCRWLLLSLDRLPGREVAMTQELIASMLGVRREGVSESATRLQKAGVIRYARGNITVLEREALEQRSCECYAVVKREYDRLLEPPPSD